jgi:hypothetical protein
MSTTTPFFSKDNIKLLYEIVQDYVYRTLMFRIGGEYVNELTNIMKYVFRQNGSPKNPTAPTIQRLNRATLDEALPLFEKLIRDSLGDQVPNRSVPPTNQHNPPRPTTEPDNLEMDSYLNDLQQPSTMSTNLHDLVPLENAELMPPGTYDDTTPLNDPYFDNRYDRLPASVKDHDDESQDVVNDVDDNDDDVDETDDNSSSDDDTIVPIEGTKMSTTIAQLSGSHGHDQKKNDDHHDDIIDTAFLGLPTTGDGADDQAPIRKMVLVDSRQRDLYRDPNANMYRVGLNQLFENVCAVELVTAEIPHSEYIVTQRNNLLHFQESEDDICIAEIEEGNYSPELLRERLEQAMIEASQHDIIYRIRLDKLKNKYSIMSPALYPLQFNLLFVDEDDDGYGYRARTIGKLLGFAPTNLYGENEYIGAKSYDFSPDKYILIHCEELMTLGNDLYNQDFLAKIVLDVPLGETKYFMRSNLNRFVCEFDPPIDYLDGLSLSFRTYDGELYDFRGCENSLTLEIATVKPGLPPVLDEAIIAVKDENQNILEQLQPQDDEQEQEDEYVEAYENHSTQDDENHSTQDDENHSTQDGEEEKN